MLHGIVGSKLAVISEGLDEEDTSLRDTVTAEGYGDSAVICGIAERLNTLKAFFHAELIPSTSKDPYGLKRTADEVIIFSSNSNITL